MHIKLGADPEFFLKKDGINVSAFGLVTGTKREPCLVQSGAVQLDGTAVEFNINPASSAHEFVSNINTVLGHLRASIDSAYDFHFSPSVEYDPKTWRKIPKECKELGCDPDFNAYTETMNPKPIPKRGYTRVRTGAGHLHVGWAENLDPNSKSHIWDCCLVVKNLDNYFSRFEPLWDDDTRRRTLYGNKGAFRPKPYGVEYRVLSNAWLRYPKMWPWLFDSVQYVMNEMEQGRQIIDFTHKKKPIEHFYQYHPKAPRFDTSLLET